MEPPTLHQIEDAVQRAFSAGVDNKRYIDTSRIPLICQSINQIHIDVKDIKESIEKNIVTKAEFWPVKTFVYGLIGLSLLTIMAKILSIVVKV